MTDRAKRPFLKRVAAAPVVQIRNAVTFSANVFLRDRTGAGEKFEMRDRRTEPEERGSLS